MHHDPVRNILIFQCCHSLSTSGDILKDGRSRDMLVASPGEILTSAVTDEVKVPVNTRIRIQISNINNPPTPIGSLTVSITTRNDANMIIDGPTATSAYNMVQVGNAQIAPGAVTTSQIATGAVTSGDIADSAITSTKPAEFHEESYFVR